MHAVIRHYQDEAADVVEQVRAHASSLTELMSGIEGFAAYYLIDIGNGGVATISVFADRSGSDESTRAAAKWLQETGLSPALPNPPTVLQGEVAIDAVP